MKLKDKADQRGSSEELEEMDLESLFTGSSGRRGDLIVTDFTTSAAVSFRRQLHERARMMGPMAPIVIYVDSYGGSVDALASMLESMDEIPNPKVTVCIGKAMSAGAVLLSHGDVRFCGQHSRVMIHEVSAGAGGNVHDITKEAEEIKRMNEYFMSLLARNCGIKGGYAGLREQIKQHDGREWYMHAGEAKEFGLVDFVGTPRIEALTLFNITPHKKQSQHREMLKAQQKAAEETPKKSKKSGVQNKQNRLKK